MKRKSVLASCSQNAFPVKRVTKREGREGELSHSIEYIYFGWQTPCYRETSLAVAVIKNNPATCHYWQITRLKNCADCTGAKVALPRKVDTWSITLMADDISPRRPSASLVVHPGWRFFTGMNLRGQSVAIHSATKDDPLCLLVHLSHCGCRYVSIIPWLQNSFVLKFVFCPFSIYQA